jgi:hypothetical protein
MIYLLLIPVLIGFYLFLNSFREKDENVAPSETIATVIEEPSIIENRVAEPIKTATEIVEARAMEALTEINDEPIYGPANIETIAPKRYTPRYDVLDTVSIHDASIDVLDPHPAKETIYANPEPMQEESITETPSYFVSSGHFYSEEEDKEFGYYCGC